MKLSKVDVILPTWNNSQLTLRCLTALSAYTVCPYRVIWVDNGSEQSEYKKVYDWLQELNIEFKPIAFDKNLGPTRALNAGIRESESRYIVLMNNDTFVTDRWLSKLVEILEANPDIGLICPVTDNISCPARWTKLARILKLPVTEPVAMYFNSRPSGFFAGRFLVSFFCVAIRKEVIEKIGLLCEELEFFGSDDDYCDRIREAGFKTAIATNCFAYHVHRATIKNLPAADLQAAKAQRSILRMRREERAKARRPD